MSGLYATGDYGLIVRDTVEDNPADKNNQFGSLDGGSPATVTYTWG